MQVRSWGTAKKWRNAGDDDLWETQEAWIGEGRLQLAEESEWPSAPKEAMNSECYSFFVNKAGHLNRYKQEIRILVTAEVPKR